MNGKPIAFCQCEDGYADPECSTERKSQFKAFLWSLSLGMFGADYFYLGFPIMGLVKMLTLGGFGFWWLADVVRIASGPVYSSNYRVANDLDHAWAILLLIFLCGALGTLGAVEQYMTYRANKRKDLEWLRQSEEKEHYKHTREHMERLAQKYGALADSGSTSSAPINTGSYARMYPEQTYDPASEQGHGEVATEMHGHAEHGGHGGDEHGGH
jgi:hypothetical protein